MKQNYSDERRTFLKTVALLGGAAAILPMAKEAAADSKPALTQPGRSEQGYRETEHIRNYYRAARI